MREEIIFKLRDETGVPEKTASLTRILQGTGIDVIFDATAECLKFNYETSCVEKKRTRGAGRNRVVTDITYTVKDVKELCKNHSKHEICEILGVSRATFYRRLKEAEHKSDNSSFLADA